jgi:hypothetical protein
VNWTPRLGRAVIDSVERKKGDEMPLIDGERRQEDLPYIVRRKSFGIMMVRSNAYMRFRGRRLDRTYESVHPSARTWD